MLLALIFNPLVPKANDCECQDPPFPLQIKPAKASLQIFAFYTLGNNGLKWISYLLIDSSTQVLRTFIFEAASNRLQPAPEEVLLKTKNLLLDAELAELFLQFSWELTPTGWALL